MSLSDGERSCARIVLLMHKHGKCVFDGAPGGSNRFYIGGQLINADALSDLFSSSVIAWVDGLTSSHTLVLTDRYRR